MCEEEKKSCLVTGCPRYDKCARADPEPLLHWKSMGVSPWRPFFELTKDREVVDFHCIGFIEK